MAEAPPTGLHTHRAWVVVAASLLIEFFGIGFGFFALVASYPTFEAMGWDRTTVVASSSIMILVIAVLSPFVGAWMDRHSIRALFVAGGLVMAAGHAILGFASTPATFFLGAAVLGLGMSGVTILPNQVLISRWFTSRLGLANGIVSSGTVLGGALSTMVVTLATEAWGRTTAFLLLAVCVGVVPPLVSLLLVRDRPSDVGLEPYEESGDERLAAERAAAAQGRAAPPSLREAMREPVFRWLAAGILLATVPCYTSNKHLILYLHDLGLDATSAASVKSMFILFAGVGRLAAGLLADRFPRAAVLLGVQLLAAVGFPLVFLMPWWPAVLAYVVLFGLAYGGIMPMMPILVVEGFGLAALGTVLGVIKTGYDLGAASAPLAAAWIHDRTGTYDAVFLANGLCAWAAVACGWMLRARLRERASAGAVGPGTKPA
ncbi:MAG: MFS transporter [Alphaproteobacteria bacterium]